MKYKVFIFIIALFIVPESYGATITVSNTNDAGAGSLRQAIIDANNDADLDVIEFDIGTGLHTIQPLTPLPVIVNDLIIDGTSQPGFVDVPIIEIDGSVQGVSSILRFNVVGTADVHSIILNGGPQSGIFITGCTGGNIVNCYIGTNAAGTATDGNAIDGIQLINSNAFIIRDCIISGNGFDGVFISDGSVSNMIKGCKIGTNRTGDQDLGNGAAGIRIDSSFTTTIGGFDPNDRNIISGNEDAGVQIENISTENVVIGNFIGTDVSGSIGIPNEFGVFINESSSNNSIGGEGGAEGNLISGNVFSGIAISQNSNGTIILGNQIGVNIGFSGVLPNGEAGIVLDDSDDCTIGNGTTNGQNLISGNVLSGITLQNGSDGNLVFKNLIGTDDSGTSDLGNTGPGISIVNSGGNSIGSPTGRNIISGNDEDGISISGAASINNVIQNNIIGLAMNGLVALPNDEFGIVIFGSAGANQLGGLGADEGNIVSGNLFSGIATAADDQTIEGNRIGTDLNGEMDLGNDDNGIFINGGSNCVIEQNLISGNTLNGIALNSEATGNLIVNNKIGTNQAGNAAIENSDHGIRFDDANSNTVGGSNAGDSNLISGNDSAGIRINNSDGNKILGNKIGTDITGNNSVPNNDAIFLGSGSNNNEIGGVNPNEGNLLSGNNFDGIDINSNSIGTIIKGNIIGLTIDGLDILENGDNGIEIDDSPNSIIGGITSNERNIVSGNADFGIVINNSTVDGALIIGNYIGTNINGTSELGNGDTGIDIDADGVTIGGGTAEEGNLISGNGDDGIFYSGDDAIIQGNRIGTDVNGEFALSNVDDGIEVTGDNAMIGGGIIGEGNLVSGNESRGIDLFGDDGVIKGNIVGLDVNGINALSNEDTGVSIEGENLEVGGVGTNDGNLISANGSSGIDIFGGNNILIAGNIIGLDITGTIGMGNFDDGINDGSGGFVTIGGINPAARNIISDNGISGISTVFALEGEIIGNFIGTDISGTQNVGNGAEGIAFFATENYAVGGTVPGSQNIIAFNAMDGVGLSDDQFFFTGLECENILVSENSIFNNGVKGINYLGAQTVVAIPVLTSVSPGVSPTVQGTLNGTPNTDYTIEFFKSLNVNASGNHEGKIFLGSDVVSTDGVGNAIINSTLNELLNIDEVVTATAVEANANTSEFSEGVAVGALPIELLSLTAHPVKEGIRLRWSTVNEVNNEGFYIERMDQNQGWTSIAFINGHGTKVNTSHYIFTDNEVLENRTSYYRLKQVDFDGRFEYSIIVSAMINTSSLSISNVYPNPASDISYIDTNSKGDEKVHVAIYNQMGQKVYTMNRTIEKREQLKLPVSQLASGKFIVQITIGNKLFVRELIKN